MKKEKFKMAQHSLIHEIRPAKCDCAWNSMSGSESLRTCPSCKTRAYNVAGLDEQGILDLIRKTEPAGLLQTPLKLYRRKDGTLMLSPGTSCTRLPVVLGTLLITGWALAYTFGLFNSVGLLQLVAFSVVVYFMGDLCFLLYKSKEVILCLFSVCAAVLILYIIFALAKIELLRIIAPVLSLLHTAAVVKNVSIGAVKRKTGEALLRP